MALVISSNFAASFAARTLEKNNDNLTRSLNKLSSGQRIVQPTDDAGGFAVQLKMKAQVQRTSVTKNNIQNAISFLQTQDGVLQTATEVVGRIAELKSLSTDATKSSSDLQNYNEEYQVLRQQLTDLQSEKFNGVNMFGTNGGDAAGATDSNQQGVFEIFTTEQGNAASAPSVIISGVYLSSTGGNASATNAGVHFSISGGFSGDVTSMTSGGLASAALSMDGILSDLQNLANARAVNGALQSRMNYAYDQASISKINLEAARSRIIDVDVAEESTNFAKHNIMTQAAASMLSQANATGRTALQLLMG
jgi:flagellin